MNVVDKFIQAQKDVVRTNESVRIAELVREDAAKALVELNPDRSRMLVVLNGDRTKAIVLNGNIVMDWGGRTVFDVHE